MNTLGISLVWAAAQVTLFALFGMAAYAAARRWGPAASALAAAASLAVVLLVSACALAPAGWSWSLPALLASGTENEGVRQPAPQDVPVVQPGAPAAKASPAKPTASVAAGDDHPQWLGGAADAEFWKTLWSELAQPRPAAASSSWRWPAIVSGVLLIGMALGLARLLLGLLAVERDRARSTAIDDLDLRRLAAELAARMGCRRPIEVRQSASVASPATVGWLRPLVLLPDDWREWSGDERRAVLAHEIAHIRRGDYLAGLAAQASLALHFYHPLVHWLAGRLRLDQELAADAMGEMHSGGRGPYVATLARLALRQDDRRRREENSFWDRRVSWAARPFLPRRGILLRRIKMLTDKNRSWRERLSPGLRWGLILLLIAAGVLVTGLRGPADRSSAQAAQNQEVEQQRAAAERAKAEQRLRAARLAQAAARERTAPANAELTFVPPDAVAVVAVRPAGILAQPKVKQLVDNFSQQADLENKFGVKLEDVEFVQLIARKGPPGALRGIAAGLVLRTAKPQDWKKAMSAVTGEGKVDQATYLGQAYSKAAVGPDGIAWFQADDRTLVVDQETHLLKYIVAARRPKPRPWAAVWQRLSGGQFTAMLNVKEFRGELGGVVERAGQQGPDGAALVAFAPLWEDTDTVLAGLEAGDELKLQLEAACPSAEAAGRVDRTAQAAVTLARNAFEKLRGKLDAVPADQAKPMLLLAEAAEEIFDSAKFSHEEATVTFQATTTLDVGTTFGFMLPAVMTARQAAGRAQSMNNLKQIAIALHNYHDVHGHFPPPEVLGPDGKTVHSWRVEILPYVEQDALYRQYKMDEPWDSDNNRKVMEQMPRVFLAPGADPASKSPSYFLITGEATAFHGNKGSSFAQVLDGTSNTIMTVEAVRDIPWTKPEDIPYDAAGPLPKLGGYFPNGFNAGLMDGSVRFILDTVDEKTLRALFTCAGGELVQVP